MSTPHLAPATKARLLREISLLHKDPPPGIAAYAPSSDSSGNQSNNLTTLRAQITGPASSPFSSGIFLIAIQIPPRYPFEPPRCRFLTPIYHPNIDSGGRICLDTLKSPPAGSWSPAVSLSSLLLSIRALMADPNPDDGLVPEIAELYKRNLGGWEAEARRRTEREASGERMLEVERRLDGGDVTVAVGKCEKERLNDNETVQSEERGDSGETCEIDADDESKRRQSSNSSGDVKETNSAEERECKRRKK